MTARILRSLLALTLAVAMLALGSPVGQADAANNCTNPNLANCIYGVVVDANTMQPVDQACVTLGPPISCATMTDASGYFEIFIPLSGLTWDINILKTPFYSQYYSGTFPVNGKTPTPANQGNVAGQVKLTPTGVPLPGQLCVAPNTATPTQTVYLPNITKTLGGANGWVTPFIVQNTGTTTTSLEVSFYKFSDGTCVARRTVSNLLAGTSFADIPNNDSDLPGDTQFSVVVKSFGATIVSTVNQVQGTGAGFQALSYSGTSTGSTTAYLPNVTRRFYGWDVPFIVQNVGSSSTTATAAFTSIASPSCTTPHTWSKQLTGINPGSSKVVDPDFEATWAGLNGSGLMDGCQYSVVVTSGQPIAVVANAHNESGAPVAYSHNALTGGAPTIYAPYAAVGGPGGRFSPIVVQNVGTSAVDASLEFTPLGGGVAKTFTLTAIAGGASKAFDPRYGNGDTTQALCTGASATCLANGEYSMKITSTGNVAAVVLPVTGTTAAAYAAALAGNKKSYLPNVTRTLGGSSGWTTPIVLQSTTATAVTLKWYRFSDGSLITTQNLTMTPNTAQWIDPRSVTGLSDDTQYAVVADGGANNITAIVYERNTSGGDGDMIYEGFASP